MKEVNQWNINYVSKTSPNFTEILRKYLGVQTWRVKKEKNRERKERQTGKK